MKFKPRMKIAELIKHLNVELKLIKDVLICRQVLKNFIIIIIIIY